MPKTMTGPPEAKPGDPVLKAVIYPDHRKIGCVLLQAVYGGNSTVPQLFDGEYWATAPLDGGRGASGTVEQWRWLAKHWAKKGPKHA